MRPRYAELHCKTNFSFLEGASHADELIQRAAELEYAALAVTDRNSLAGVVRAHTAAKQHGLQLIIGAEITPSDAPPVVLWVPDRTAYGRLSRLITCGRRRAAKGDCRLTLADVFEHAEGLLAGVCLTTRTWDLDGPTNQPSRSKDDSSAQRPLPIAAIQAYRERFGDRGSLLVELHHGPDDEQWLDRLQQVSQQTGLPLLAAGDVHYHIPARLPLHDVLTAIRYGVTVDSAGDRLFANAQRHLRSVKQIARLLQRIPQALERTLEVANQCHFSLEELRYEYPEELAPPQMTPFEYLQQQTWQGAAPLSRRYPRQGLPCVEARIAVNQRTALRGLFLDRMGPGAVRSQSGNSVPGKRLGRQFGCLLLPGRNRRRSHMHRSVV